MSLIFLEKYLIYSVETSQGRTDYYYYDEITWIVGVLTLSWMAWFVIRRVIQARKQIRGSDKSGNQQKSLRRVINAKNELSHRYLKKGVSENIHAVGIGKTNGAHCIQVFTNSASEDVSINSRTAAVPGEYKDIPVLLIEMPEASFLGAEVSKGLADQNEDTYFSSGETPSPIRDRQDVILGGISGANANLNGQSGTIGFFCKKRSVIHRKSATYLLSNTHVFADLRNPEIDEHDLIVQPSPGEPKKSDPIGELTGYSDLKLDNDIDDPNTTDAAIAKLWRNQEYQMLVPMIGGIKGYAKKEDVEVGEFARKFGRTTGFTAGNVFSIYLDIWIKYDRTGQKAFFKDQILIEPNNDFEKFVDKGDSGSLVVDGENYASGLIFAGASGKLQTEDALSEESVQVDAKVDGYGVANPISDVLNELKVDFIEIDRS